MKTILTILLGFLFGWILIGTEAFSWYRIQEMFHFQSFHMYGVLSSAILTGAISLFVLKKFNIKSINGGSIIVKPKPIQLKANVIGGLIFGLGWGLSGACSAPVFILLGGFLLLGSLLGVLIYGIFDNKLPKKNQYREL
jgi:uncharacterized membrane protein YedE/YeeE